MRQTFVVGHILPSRSIRMETTDDKLRRLEAERGEAHKRFLERRDHHNEIAYWKAVMAVEDFIAGQNPRPAA